MKSLRGSIFIRLSLASFALVILTFLLSSLFIWNASQSALRQQEFEKNAATAAAVEVQLARELRQILQRWAASADHSTQLLSDDLGDNSLFGRIRWSNTSLPGGEYRLLPPAAGLNSNPWLLIGGDPSIEVELRLLGGKSWFINRFEYSDFGITLKIGDDLIRCLLRCDMDDLLRVDATQTFVEGIELTVSSEMLNLSHHVVSLLWQIVIIVLLATVLGLFGLSIIYFRMIVSPLAHIRKQVLGVLRDQKVAPLRGSSEIVQVSQYIAEAAEQYSDIQMQLQQRQFYDEVTGLPNRSLATIKIERELATAVESQAAHQYLILISVKSKHAITESYGHRVADQAVNAMVDRMTDRLSAATVLPQPLPLFRISSNSLALLPGAISEEELKLLSEQIVLLGQESLIVDDIDLFLPLTLGVVDLVTAQVTTADEALIAAANSISTSSSRQPIIHYQSKLFTHSFNRSKLLNALPDALRLSQFYLVYQPVYSVENQQLVGAEALIRWNHPEYGQVSPVEFISLLEEHGMMGQVGFWILWEAMSQWKRWKGTTAQLEYVSINVSPYQLRDGFIQKFIEMVAELDIPFSAIELELTESELLTESSAWQQLQSLRQLGVRIALDDFGTGYSNFTQLSHMPFDRIKIDRSFIQQIEQKDESSLVETLLRFAHSFGADTTAEGVEHLNTLNILHQHQCSAVQGFALSRPLTAEQFDALFANQTVDNPSL